MDKRGQVVRIYIGKHAVNVDDVPAIALVDEDTTELLKILSSLTILASLQKIDEESMQEIRKLLGYKKGDPLFDEVDLKQMIQEYLGVLQVSQLVGASFRYAGELTHISGLN